MKDKPNKPSKFRSKNWVVINDDSHGVYSTDVKDKLCDYDYTYTLVKKTRTDERDKQVIFKNCVPLTKFISEKNNNQVYYGQEIDAVIPMYNLLKYIDNYYKISGGLWEHDGDEPNATLTNFESSKFKVETAGK